MVAEDFCASVRDGTHDSPKQALLGKKLVTSRHIIGGRIDLDNAYLISDRDFAEINRRSKVDQWDVLITMIGTVGEPCLVSSNADFAIKNIGLFKSKSQLHGQWLYYYLKTPVTQDLIRSRTSGTTQAYIALGTLRSLPIVCPDSAAEMAAIVNCLAALDDKIELNRKMNATLEAMARALFRDWFVDFGPTRAKMAGEAPYLSPTLWPLFPDRLDAEGKPEGWEEKPLDEIADFLNGLALQKFPGETEPNSLPVIKIAELRNGITANSNRASRKVPGQYVIQDGDFLFSWSGSLLAKFWTSGEGALNQHLFKVSSGRYPAWFFSEWVQHHLEEFQMIAASKATTMGHIQRGHLRSAKTIGPPDDVIQRMGDMMAPLIDRIIRNELESRTLAQTRDLLLPRLMSGELRLAETPAALEAAQ